VALVESANIYDRFFANRSVAAIARYFGFCSPQYRVVDSSVEQVAHSFLRGMARYTVGRTWKDADLRISFAKMRSHPVDLVDLTLGNMEGVGGRSEQFVSLDRQGERETSIMMLLDELPPHFSLLDGYEHAADGLMAVRFRAQPLSPRRLYASADALALDWVAARHLGVRDPRASRVLRAAAHWFAEASPSPQVVGVDEPVAGWRHPHDGAISRALSFLMPVLNDLGSRSAALLAPEMDTEAFPPHQREGTGLRWGRKAFRRLLALA
jgi:uncharacterized protein (DUF362 family)